MHVFPHYDVLVVGGGTAGAVAAIQAGRLGASVLLVEMTGQLGGAITNGHVSAPAYFWSPDRQIISGIGWELAQKTRALGGPAFPDFGRPNPRRPSYHVPLNRHLWALVAEEECLRAGVDLHYHEILTAVRDGGDGFWEIRTAGKGLEGRYRAREIIDCSGDADAVRLAGFPVVRAETRQPATLSFHIGGIDFDAVDPDALQRAYEDALASGELEAGDFCYRDRPFIDFLRGGGRNLQHIFGGDSTTSATQTDASIRGRRSLLRLLRFIRRQAGCENATVDSLAPVAAARDTWRIVGEHTITHDEYLAGVVYPDAVCNTLYFIDVHDENGTRHEFLPPGTVPTIPLSALVPKGSRRLLAAGRILSADTLAHSALRVECSCFAMGQAAGAAAALGVRLGVPSRSVPPAVLRAELRRQGAIVPDVD